MGATEVEAEIIVTIGRAAGEEEGTVNGMRHVKEGGKSCVKEFEFCYELAYILK